MNPRRRRTTGLRTIPRRYRSTRIERSQRQTIANLSSIKKTKILLLMTP